MWPSLSAVPLLELSSLSPYLTWHTQLVLSDAGTCVSEWGVTLVRHLSGHFQSCPSVLHRPGPLQAKSFTILSPFLSLSRGQWRPEESEDYVSNRCAKHGQDWVRLGSWDTPPLPACVAKIHRAPATSRENWHVDMSTRLSSDWRFL